MNDRFLELFLTHHNLQGSQTMCQVLFCSERFLTHHNLQGSQTFNVIFIHEFRFLTHHNLQGSQTKTDKRKHG